MRQNSKKTDIFEHKKQRILTSIVKMIDDKNDEATKSLLETVDTMDGKDEFLRNISDADYCENLNNIATEAFNNRRVNRFRSRLLATKNRRRRVTARISVAVSVVAAIVISAIVYVNRPEAQIQNIVASNSISHPTLIVEGGESLALTSKVQSSTSNDSITKLISNKNLGKLKQDTQRTIIIPKGYTFKLKLDDGSEVILNSNSKLVYPTSFTANSGERRVKLSGEGYFSVKKQDIPFIVECDEGEVRVYGTSFNVKNSGGDRFETVLVEGSVGVTPKGGSEVVISPNQMFALDNDTGKGEVLEINPEDYLQWIKGRFYYDMETLKRVLYDVGDWYNVTFTIDDNVDTEDIKLVLYLHKGELHKVVSIIEKTADVKIINEGNGRYYVTNK